MIRFIFAHVELWTRPIPVNYCSLLTHMVANDCWHLHPAKHQKAVSWCRTRFLAPSLPRTNWHCSKLRSPTLHPSSSRLRGLAASHAELMFLKEPFAALSKRKAGYPESKKKKHFNSTQLSPFAISQESVYHRRCSLMIWGYSRAKNHPHVNVIPPFVAKSVAMWWWGYLWGRWSFIISTDSSGFAFWLVNRALY